MASFFFQKTKYCLAWQGIPVPIWIDNWEVTSDIVTETDKKLLRVYNNVIKKKRTDIVSVLVFLVYGNVTRTFLYGSLIAVWNGLYNPMCYILGRRIEWQNGVEILMVKFSMNEPLYLGKVNHHTVVVKLACLTITFIIQLWPWRASHLLSRESRR